MHRDLETIQNLEKEYTKYVKHLSDEENLIVDFLNIVRDNVSEDYCVLGTDCYVDEEKHLYRFQAWIEPSTDAQKIAMVNFLHDIPSCFVHFFSISFGDQFRVVLTMDIYYRYYRKLLMLLWFEGADTIDLESIKTQHHDNTERAETLWY